MLQVSYIKPRASGLQSSYAFGTGIRPSVWIQMFATALKRRTHIYPSPLCGELNAYAASKAAEESTPFTYISNQIGNPFCAEYRSGIPKYLAAHISSFGGKT